MNGFPRPFIRPMSMRKWYHNDIFTVILLPELEWLEVLYSTWVLREAFSSRFVGWYYIVKSPGI